LRILDSYFSEILYILRAGWFSDFFDKYLESKPLGLQALRLDIQNPKIKQRKVYSKPFDKYLESKPLGLQALRLDIQNPKIRQRKVYK
jgi:hypothetical protein